MEIVNNTESMVNREENMVDYLQMIQEPINRMSTTSAIFKGFAATIVGGICTLSEGDGSKWLVLISIIPVVAFAILDLYYLVLERKFRYLYNQVREGKHECNYSLELISNDDEDALKEAEARIQDCIKSLSFWSFYSMICIFLIIVFICKNCGVF